MRPDRAIVKKAISDAEGNLSRAAALLGCTRQTLYTWLYQHGLERFAGVRMDRRRELDSRERLDTPASKQNKPGVYSPDSGRPILRAVSSTTTADAPEVMQNATVKLPETLWKRAKIESIREGCTLSEYVARSLENQLSGAGAGAEAERPRAAGRRASKSKGGTE